VAAWSWWWVVSPFVLAVIWWAIADATGYTQRQVMRRYDERKEQRRHAHMEAMGMQAHLPGARGKGKGRKPPAPPQR
ncbi:MAG: TIGR04438 family Trp-rich protein, partial [Aquabacterium sp.]